MHTFTVELRYSAEFPKDMLRYDSATPATQDDQDLIDLMSVVGSDRSQLRKTVHITLNSTDRHAPHVARWESFGARVVESNNPYTVLSRPAPNRATETRLDHLSINKRDVDAYDIFYKALGNDRYSSGRVARLRASYNESEDGVRTVVAGSWRIIWEGDPLGMTLVDGVTSRNFDSVYEAYGAFVEKYLG